MLERHVLILHITSEISAVEGEVLVIPLMEGFKIRFGFIPGGTIGFLRGKIIRPFIGVGRDLHRGFCGSLGFLRRVYQRDNPVNGRILGIAQEVPAQFLAVLRSYLTL